MINQFRNAWKQRRALTGNMLYWSGLASLYEMMARPEGAIVLMYHSVAESKASEFVDPPNRISPELFNAQMTFLKNWRNVISMSQLIADLEAGRTPEAGTVCLTFDDGYRDNYTVVAPILRDHGLPATIYLATEYVSRQKNQWADELFVAMHRRTLHRLRVPTLSIDADLRHAPGFLSARRALHKALLESTFEQRHSILAAVKNDLKPDGEALVPRLTMNWDEVRRLAEDYPLIEIGGHSCSHLDLRAHCDGLAASEINGCCDDVLRETGTKPAHFSFPYGRWAPASRDIVVNAGWRSAVGSSPEVRVTSTTDRFVIPRVETPQSMHVLRFVTSGGYPGAYAMLGKQ